MVVATGVVPDSEDAEASLREMLAAALETNQEMARLAAELREENARLRAENARQAAELKNLRADFVVFQRMLFGRSSERCSPEPDSGDGDGDGGRGGERQDGPGESGKKRGPGARAGRRDYSHLPRVEVIWDFDGGGYCCPECGEPLTLLGEHVSEQRQGTRVRRSLSSGGLARWASLTPQTHLEHRGDHRYAALRRSAG